MILKLLDSAIALITTWNIFISILSLTLIEALLIDVNLFQMTKKYNHKILRFRIVNGEIVR